MKKFALIGHNISYSLSPEIHAEIFARIGIKASYELLSVTKEELPALIPYLRDLDGFNVTKPHKENILPFLEPGAPKSVNTVAVRGGKMYGYSTDGYGFSRDLAIRFGKVSGTALVLGAGGVARVIAAELKAAGMEVFIRNRTKERAAALAAELGVKHVRRISDVAPDLAVNCTSFGFNAGENPAEEGGMLALDRSRLKWVYDTIYSPSETEFLRSFPQAKRANGLGMLILQAVEADRIMCGADISEKLEREIYDKLTKELADADKRSRADERDQTKNKETLP